MSNSKARRRRPKLYADDVLLDAAAQVFQEKGFRATSMAEIAERSGATKPTLYAHFGGKASLYDRILERAADSLLATVAAAYKDIGIGRANGTDPDAGSIDADRATEAPVTAFFSWARSSPAAFHLLFAPEDVAPTGVDHRQRAMTALTELIEWASSEYLVARGMRPGRATGLIASYVVAVLYQGARWGDDHGLLDTGDIAAFSSKFILAGLGGLDPKVTSRLARRRAAQ